jgi:hypothetical protein
MVSNHLKELEAARAKVADLEQSIATELKAELAALPFKYGFETAKAFLKAVRGATGTRRGRRPGSKAGAKSTGKRTRVRITDEMRADVKKLASVGKTGAEIAKTVGISLPSVQNIKKAFGLVKKRK